jgi:nitrite reductase (cytochrome c-552)
VIGAAFGIGGYTFVYAKGAAKQAGASDAQLVPARDFQRRAQFYLDFIEAENSMSFHASQEAARILGHSIDFSRQARRRCGG